MKQGVNLHKWYAWIRKEGVHFSYESYRIEQHHRHTLLVSDQEQTVSLSYKRIGKVEGMRPIHWMEWTGLLGIMWAWDDDETAEQRFREVVMAYLQDREAYFQQRAHGVSQMMRTLAISVS